VGSREEHCPRGHDQEQGAVRLAGTVGRRGRQDRGQGQRIQEGVSPLFFLVLFRC